jgi:DNA-binding protein H-NS
MINLSELSVPELKALLNEIPKEIQRREKDEKVRVRKELEALAAKHGFSLDELLGQATNKVPKASKPVATKYRHPTDMSLAWSGRGRQPRWVVEFLAQGGTLDQLAV